MILVELLWCYAMLCCVLCTCIWSLYFDRDSIFFYLVPKTTSKPIQNINPNKVDNRQLHNKKNHTHRAHSTHSYHCRFHCQNATRRFWSINSNCYIRLVTLIRFHRFTKWAHRPCFSCDFIFYFMCYNSALFSLCSYSTCYVILKFYRCYITFSDSCYVIIIVVVVVVRRNRLFSEMCFLFIYLFRCSSSPSFVH